MSIPSHTLFPLGDAAVLLDYGNIIDEEINAHVLRVYRGLLARKASFILNIVPAYSSLAVMYDPGRAAQQLPPADTVFEAVATAIEGWLREETPANAPGRTVRIPVCYEPSFAPDLAALAEARGLSVNDCIALHTGTPFRVYMIGFLPGFPYMGEVPEALAAPRKAVPRAMVPAGAVGIAGRQTGIYPQASPGGWQLIGQTPLALFDPAAEMPTLLQPGDTVHFYSITADEYTHYQSRTV
jgi:inhibitor of KinA